MNNGYTPFRCVSAMGALVLALFTGDNVDTSQWSFKRSRAYINVISYTCAMINYNVCREKLVLKLISELKWVQHNTDCMYLTKCPLSVISAARYHCSLTSIQMWCIPPDLFFCKKPAIGLFSPRGWSSSSLVLPSSTNTV